jgi:hypothetical protein
VGLFRGVEEAKFNEGGIWFLDGNYLVKVDVVKVGETRKKVDFFVVEHTICWSDNPQRKKGTQCSWMATADKDAFLGNVKHFCSVASETPMDEVTEEGIEMIVSEENPLAGTILRVQATTIKTKAGGDFTKVIYKHINEADIELLKSLGVEIPEDNPVNLDDEAA